MAEELVLEDVRVTYGETTAVAGVSLTLGPGLHAYLAPTARENPSC